MRGKLICFGDLCIDIVGRTQQIDGSDVPLSDLSVRPGGGALNCATAAASEGVEVELLGMLGKDAFGELIRSRLVDAQVKTERVRTGSGRTGTTVSVVNREGQNRLYSYRGVNAEEYGNICKNYLARMTGCTCLGIVFKTQSRE